MFPISDSIKTSRFPYLNIFLIVLTVFVFIQQILAPDPNAFLARYALIPSKANLSDFTTLVPFVTAIFLHGGILHILSNMWFLWIFGDNVEDVLSPVLFLLLYMTAGIVGNVVQFALMPHSTIPMLGASGAIAGILGFYYVLFPYAKVKTFIPFFFFFTIIDISAPIMLGYWFLLQLISGAISLPFSQDQGGIAFWAHIAGFIVGIVFAYLFGRNAKRIYQDNYSV